MTCQCQCQCHQQTNKNQQKALFLRRRHKHHATECDIFTFPWHSARSLSSAKRQRKWQYEWRFKTPPRFGWIGYISLAKCEMLNAKCEMRQKWHAKLCQIKVSHSGHWLRIRRPPGVISITVKIPHQRGHIKGLCCPDTHRCQADKYQLNKFAVSSETSGDRSSLWWGDYLKNWGNIGTDPLFPNHEAPDLLFPWNWGLIGFCQERL